MNAASWITHPAVERVLAFIAGAIGVLAFSPFDIWPAAPVSLFGLLFFIQRNSPKRAALLGFCWGFGLFLFGVSWVYVSIQHFGGVSAAISGALVLLLAAYLAFFPALFGYLLVRFWQNRTLARLSLVAPALWFMTEWLRGTLFGGFPWLQFGYSQIDGPLKFIAPILGVDAITLLLFSISGLLVYAVQQKQKMPLIGAIILFFAPIMLKPIEWVKMDPSRTADIALIQGNTDQAIKWSASHLNTIIDTYTQLTLPYIGKKPIIIWPEAAIPSLENYQQPFLSELDTLARKHHSQIALGIVNYDRDENAYYNSVIVLGKEAPYQYPAATRYNKHHLVPFGETVPFQFLFDVIARVLAIPMSNMTSGDYIQAPLIIDGFQFVTAVCYEIILGQQLRDNFTEKTDFILTISNDTWFGRSIGPWQHFQMARMRALELGRPVIRGTNNGITAVINTNGDIVEAIPQFTQAVLSVTVPTSSGFTPFVTWGFTLYRIFLGSLMLTAFWLLFRQKKECKTVA